MSEASARRRTHGDAMRVLVVDDDWAALEPLLRLLQLDDVQAVGFRGGAEAVDALERERFDAVVTDMEMPFVDGAQVVRAARRTQGDAIPIVVVSGRARPSDVIACGANVLLVKPVDYDQLLVQLRR